MFTYFNNASIRKLVIGFGSLFNNIYIKQLNKNGSDRDTLVPLTYAPKEKFYKRLTLPSSISDQTRIELNTPQIAFELTTMTYDPLRKLNKINKKASTDSTVSSYMEVPYNFGFGVYAYTRNIEENLQIVEQILPYFSPEFVITLNYTEINQKVDVPVSLIQTALTQEYEGDFESSRRLIVSSFSFVAKSYVFNRVGGMTGISQWNFAADISGYTLGITGS